MIIGTIECGLVLTIEFICFQNHLVEIQESLCMLHRNIAVNAVVFFEIYPKL